MVNLMNNTREISHRLTRETFEASEEKHYNRVIHAIVISLDAFTEQEALAVLDAAKASISLRRLWRIIGNQAAKQYRGEQIFGEVGDGHLGQANRSVLSEHKGE
jgi:hypothetical protein